MTEFLFARPSILGGIAGMMDFAGALDQYNDSPTPEEADDLAIANDWAAVAGDFRAAVARFEASHPELAQAPR